MSYRNQSLFAVFFLSFLTISGVFFGCAGSASTADTTQLEGAPAQDDPLAARRAQVVDRLLASIEGRENEPASDVFDNIQVLGSMPAGQMLRVMDMGFSRSLGVGCNHCHDTNVWEADHKREKNAAREMWSMVQELNQIILPEMEHLDSPRPTINCTTCHRGQVRPALSLD